MNSTFKVVFNKARGALMVVNEATSSVQAKGTKTVVAAAVATMMAGVACADQSVANNAAYITGDLAIENGKYTPTGVVTTNKEGNKTWAATDTLASGANITFVGDKGSLTLNVKAPKEQDAGADITQELGALKGTGVVNLNGFNGAKKDEAAYAAQVTVGSLATAADDTEASDITFKFASKNALVTGDNANTAAENTLTVTDGVIGNEAVVTDKKVTTGAMAVTFDVAENTHATVVSGANRDLVLNKVAIKNAGVLTFDAAENKQIVQNAAIDATGMTGKLVFADNATVNKSVTADSIFVGQMGADESATVNYAGTATLQGVQSETSDTGVITPAQWTTFKGDKLTVASTLTLNQFAAVDAKEMGVKAAGFFTTQAGSKVNVGTFTSLGTSTLSGETTITTANVNGGTTTFAGETVIENLNVGNKDIKAAAMATVSGDTTLGTVSVLGATSQNKAKLTIDAQNKEVNVTSATVGSFGTLTVADGEKHFASVAVNGVNADSKAALAIQRGTNVFDALTVGEYGSLTVAAGDNTFTDITLGKDVEATANGNTTIGKFTAGEGAAFTQTSGKLTTDVANLVTKLEAVKDDEGKVTSYTANASTALKVRDAANVDMTGVETFTVEQHKAVKAALGNTNGALHYIDAQLKTEDGKNERWGNLASVDFYAGTSTINFFAAKADEQVKPLRKDKVITVGAINVERNDALTTAKTKVEGLTVGDGETAIVLRGNGTDILTFGEGVEPKTVTLNKVILGEKDTDTASFNKTVTIGDAGVTVAAGNFTLGDIVGTGQAVLAVTGGNLTLLGTTYEQELTIDDKKVKYTALSIGQNLSKNDKGELVNGTDFAGTLNLSGGHFLAVGNYTAQAAEALAREQGRLNEEAEEGQDPVKANVVFFGEQTVLAKVPTFTQSNEENLVYVDLGSVAANGNYLKSQNIIDAADAICDVDGVVLSGLNSKVVTFNEDGSKSINLGKFTASTNDAIKFDLGVNAAWDFYDIQGVDAATGVFTFKADKEEIKDFKSLGLNSEGAVLNAIETVEFEGLNPIASQFVTEGSALVAFLDAREQAWEDYVAERAKAENKTVAAMKDLLADELEAYEAATAAQVVRAEHTATNMAVAAGAFNVAMDVNDQVAASVNRRTSLANLNAPRTAGFTPWVEVLGSANENANYEADIYGAMLGFDYTASCGGVLGLALNIGQADSNSAGEWDKADNDADFHGFSIYAAQTFGDFNVKADLGYTQIKNDLSMNSAVFGRVAESLDSDVFTFGLGAEYLAKFGELNIVPHAGLRMSRVSMDDSKFGANYEDMTVYQMPMGVAFSGTFDMNGWKLAPMVDVAVVPAFGDKDAVATYFGGATEAIRVVDTNPIQATLGVAAQNGAWTFGVNYGLTAGSDDRMNNSLNANVRYTF